MIVQTVLTATFNSYGDRQISTPHKIDTSEHIDKKFSTIDSSERGPPIPNLVQIHPWGILGKWVKYNKKYFLFIYTFFLRLAYRTDPLKIFMRDSSKDVKSLKDVPFGGLNDVLLNFGVKTPKN